MNEPKKVFLHCSATSDYPKGSSGFDIIGASEIDRWHKKRTWIDNKGKKRFWSGIGYHLVVRQTGVIERGRDTKIRGAHTKGHNEDSIGICWIGMQFPHPEQIDSLLHLYKTLKESYGIDYSEWWGHYEVNKNKTCPGVSMEVFRRLLRAEG